METTIGSNLERLLDGAESMNPDELAAVVAETERVRRHADAVQARAISLARRQDAFREDGHRAITGWIQATIAVSAHQARQRARLAELCATHPIVAEHLSAATLGEQQANDLADVHHNPRVRDQFACVVELFVAVAELAPYHQFKTKLDEWVRMADADGAHRRAEQAHDRRGAWFSTFGDTTLLEVRVDNVAGAELKKVVATFQEAEFHADWAATKDRYGNDAAADLMPRSPTQRRADAILAVARQAASTDPKSAIPPEPLVSIVVTQGVYEEQLTALIEGRKPVFASGGVCATDSGAPVDPMVAVAAAIVGHVRRIVVDGKGRVVDVGRKRRTFTKAARDGAMIQSILDGLGGRCLWPGCGRHRTQMDHTKEWHRHGGCSDLANSSIFCLIHNIVKSHGYNAWRDDHGIWHLTRPDGTEIKPA